MKEKKSILIVDDEANIRRILEVALEKAGYRSVTVETALEALEVMRGQTFDCVLTDVTMPGMNGFELQRQIRATYADVPVIIMTAFGTIPQAVQAIRDGAYEFVTKPFDLESLKKVIASAVSSKPVTDRKSGANRPTKTKTCFIAESESMKEVLETITQVADSRATVLITGESGTGKEVVAKLLHELSPRSNKPFVAASCAALPESLLESELFGYEKGAFTGANVSKIGRFEAADQGTLFLDEIGEVPLTIQAKLLRVLQEREFERLGATRTTKIDVRLVTATNRDLSREVEDGRFRLDLLYRLQVIELYLPPLRKRREDIEPLALHFLRQYSHENSRQLTKIDDEALRALEVYAWPGNVRELGNVIERAVVLSRKDETILTPKHLPRAFSPAA